jgi:hypothetical protein
VAGSPVVAGGMGHSGTWVSGMGVRLRSVGGVRWGGGRSRGALGVV